MKKKSIPFKGQPVVANGEFGRFIMATHEGWWIWRDMEKYKSCYDPANVKVIKVEFEE